MPAGRIAPNFAMLLGLVLPLIPIILLLVVAGIVADLILRDLMLPHFALENATAGEAWRSVRARIMAREEAVFCLCVCCA